MERLIVLGTGNAQAIHCYNTCYAMQKGEEYFLVDAGGGNGILSQLDKAEIPLESIHNIFVTHAHNDHILGMVWIDPYADRLLLLSQELLMSRFTIFFLYYYWLDYVLLRLKNSFHTCVTAPLLWLLPRMWRVSVPWRSVRDRLPWAST